MTNEGFDVVPRYEGDGDDCLPWATDKSRHLVDGDPRQLLAAALQSVTRPGTVHRLDWSAGMEKPPTYSGLL
jgi:hypothetical protein